MNQTYYCVSIIFGLHSTVNFDASLLLGNDAQHLSLFRVDENGLTVKQACLVLIDLTKSKIGFVYDCFELFGVINEKKEVDGNYYFKCTTDFGSVETYVCDRNTWKQHGLSIFQHAV